MITKAMVMAAGMGSRLEPITLLVPKPLIPVVNIPLMDIILSNLASIGITNVISNTYYLSDQIINRYKDNNLGINFNYIKENTLSGTAGGLKKCQFFFNKGEDFVVMSGDLLTNVDLRKAIKIHKESGAIATIGVKKVDKNKVSSFGVVVKDEQGYVSEFQEKPELKDAKSDLINTGIYIFNYKIFDFIPENTFYDFAKDVFPKLLELREIKTFDVDEYWNDIGTIEQYKSSIQDVFNGLCNIAHNEIVDTNIGSYISGNSDIPDTTRFIGNSVVGNNCTLGDYVGLNNCIIFDNVVLDKGEELSDCVVLPSVVLDNSDNGRIIC